MPPEFAGRFSSFQLGHASLCRRTGTWQEHVVGPSSALVVPEPSLFHRPVSVPVVAWAAVVSFLVVVPVAVLSAVAGPLFSPVVVLFAVAAPLFFPVAVFVGPLFSPVVLFVAPLFSTVVVLAVVVFIFLVVALSSLVPAPPSSLPWVVGWSACFVC